MKIINKIKNLLSKSQSNDLAANVTFYKDKIIVQTFDFTEGPSIGSTKFTVLPIETSPEILGQTLISHFNLTEHNLVYKANKNAWEDFKKAAGFKTNKATYKDARKISCRKSTTEIVLTPTENKYNTGFGHRPDLNIKLPLNVSDLDLGLQLVKARELSNG